MKSKLMLSDQTVLKNYFRFLNLSISNKQQVLSSIKTSVKLKLINKRSLLRLYKRQINIRSINYILNANLFFYYCLLKRYLFTYFPWTLINLCNLRTIAFFLYHFLVLYRAIFVIKMVLDWFPVKNWDRASPIKRFLRRVTIGWTKQFEKYFPSIFAWIIVINIIPTFLYLIEGFYISNDFRYFPLNYNFDEVVEFITESNLQTFRTKLN